MGTNELRNIIKRCCDSLRRDDGISGPVEYTEALSWLLYLKFFQDKEKRRQEMATINNEEYTFILPPKYQWDSWTSDKKLSGKNLIQFIDNDLFPYLKGLRGQSEGDPRNVIRAIFQNSINKVHNGYILSDVIEQIKKINFDLDDDAFTLSHIYEDLLKNMGQGGGKSGEFYTPRPLVRLMVKLLDPYIRQKIYDPACGTGGFLAEAHLHLTPTKTPGESKILNYETFYGQEKTPLPFVLCLMNLTLHGMDYPQIIKTNTLDQDIRGMEDHEKYDVILANPPFGGKERKMIQKNFPIESSATEHLFLQHIEKKLKINGKAAVVVPEGVLFQTSKAYKTLKENLIKKCNLHTVISLPQGVFLPYSNNKTAVIIFDKTKRTKDIWFYKVSLINEKKLTKQNGIASEHFKELLQLYKKRSESQNSWLIPVQRILENNTDLSIDRYNPNSLEKEDLLDPTEYAKKVKTSLQDSLDHINQLVGQLN